MSELIDRQAALDVLCDACGNCACPKGKIPRCSYYEKMQAIPTASPWHRVEDGLPEKDEWVLTITKSYKGARIYNISTVDSDGRWWTTSQNGMREIHYIEYWMPIEPPKEEE